MYNSVNNDTDFEYENAEQGACCNDSDYMDSLCNDDAYCPPDSGREHYYSHPPDGCGEDNDGAVQEPYHGESCEDNRSEAEYCSAHADNSAIQADRDGGTDGGDGSAYSDNGTIQADRDGGDGEDGGLSVYNTEQLMNYEFIRQEYIVNDLLSPGLAVLAGSPKIGKSWLVLNLCIQLSYGKPFLGNEVKSCQALYMALEDDPRRMQKRMIMLGDDGSDRLFITHHSKPLGKSFEEEITEFEKKHPACRLIVIDTFQKIRRGTGELSYSNDYKDVSRLKKLADSLNICILLVHHTRKMADSDYMNEISGTNGIAGSADTLMVLKKEKRNSRAAVLSCTGRDIEDRELSLYLDKDSCIWKVKSDSLAEEDRGVPEEIPELIEYMKELGKFAGSNTDFTNGFCNSRGFIIDASHLKRSMNLYREELEKGGVIFRSGKINGKRRLAVLYKE